MDMMVERELREKIRALELQNMLLMRAAANRTELPQHDDGNICTATLDDFELIDVQGLELSDDDSWLYESPKSLTPEQKAIGAYGWLRKERPHEARRSLGGKFEESWPACKPPSVAAGGSAQYDPQLWNGGVASTTRHINSGTITKKSGRDWSLPLPVIDSPPSDQLYDHVGHVQAVARQQQESLRQPTPLSSPKRSSSESCRSSDRTSPDSDRCRTPAETEALCFSPIAANRQRASLDAPPTRVRPSRTSIAQPSLARPTKPNALQMLRARGASQSPCRQSASRSLSPSGHCRASPSPDRISPKTVQGHSRIPIPKTARSMPTPTRANNARLKGCNGDDSWKEGCF